MRIVASLVFILTGLFLFFYPQFEKEALDNKQEKLIQAFEQLGDEQFQENVSEIADVQINDHQMELLEGARGIVRIPKIDLEMMVFEGSTESSLSRGVGLIEPEKEFGVNNVGIAGHRGVVYGKQFNRLDELQPNDEIEIRTNSGNLEFVIVHTSVIDETEVEVLADKEEPYITLVTCTPIGKANTPYRLIVQAKLKQND